MKDPGGTEKLFNEYVAYYAAPNTQVATPLANTWWDEKARTYDTKYLTDNSRKVRLSAVGLQQPCKWTVAGRTLAATECTGVEADVEVGPIPIKVAGSRDAYIDTVIVLRDVLIATLGDSYASGEGVPDRRKGKMSPARWMDKRCHRSLYAGPSLAALMYARANPHVSVTHVSFACSGALVKEGVLHGYEGIDPADKRDLLPAQLTALKDLLDAAGRKPDYVTISAAGNDVGFANIVAAATLHGPGKVRRVIKDKVDAGILSVNALAPDLKKALQEDRTLGDPTLFITEYPNPTQYLAVPRKPRAQDGQLENLCGRRGENVVNFTPYGSSVLFSITDTEINLLHETVAPRLKTLSMSISDSIGAQFVDGIDEEFSRHGYCAPGLLGADGKSVRWVNTVRDSLTVTGSHKGAMHPNILGQSSFARHLLARFIERECATSISEEDSVHAQLCRSAAWTANLPGFERTEQLVQQDEMAELAE